MVATVEDGVVTKLRPDRDHPLSAGEACPKGIAMTDVQNDPDRVVHPLRRAPERRVRTRVLGAGDRGDRGAAAGDHRRTRAAGGRLVLRKPRCVQLLARAVGKGLPRGTGHAALLHGFLAGRREPLCGERAALRHARAGADPRPQAHELPAGGRGEPVRLARQRADGTEGQEPVPRDRRPRRARRRRRSAAQRDRAPFRARRGAPRHRRLAAAVAALRARRRATCR